MKTFEILLNNRYSATTQALTSGLDLQNDYYVYINKNGGGIVNPYNVRGYLNDSKNKQITNDFFKFLTGSTTQDQALNIVTSDKKLSDTFNDFYQNSIISGNSLSTSVVQQNLTGATQISASTFLHPWIGFAPDKQLTGITQEIYGTINDEQVSAFLEEFTTEQSYFIPVYLERGTNQLSRHKFDICDLFINSKTAGFYPQFSGITTAFFGPGSTLSTPVFSADTRLHTLLNCFVDINLETDENVGLDIFKKVSFQNVSYSISEGNIVQIVVELNSPSISGIEKVTIEIINPLTNVAINNQDYSSISTYPLTLSWAVGEQFKTIDFDILNDFFIENTESFNLKFSNFVNLDPGQISNTSVNIMDTTILRSVSLYALPRQFTSIYTQLDGNYVYAGEDISKFVDITVNLDGPAFGVEIITLDISQVPYYIANFTQAILGSDFTLNAGPTPIVISFSPGETQKIIRLNVIADNIAEDTFEKVTFELKNQQFCLIDQNSKFLSVIIQDGQTYPPGVRTVSFINDSKQLLNGTTSSVRVSLNYPSITGTESVIIDKILLPFPGYPTPNIFVPLDSEAVLNVDYTYGTILEESTPFVFTSTGVAVTLPITLTWAIGEKDKYLEFNDVLIPSTAPVGITHGDIYKYIDLKMSNISNANPGANLNFKLVFTDPVN